MLEIDDKQAQKIGKLGKNENFFHSSLSRWRLHANGSQTTGENFFVCASYSIFQLPKLNN